jgi:hypothetical protein
MSLTLRLILCLSGVICAMAAAAAPPPLLPAVEVEDQIYTYKPADNGAGPLWCYGSTCLVRIGDRLFASGLETIPDQKPLNNCRWVLYERTAKGWQRRQADPTGRQREPCPLAGTRDGRLFLSSNPTLTQPDAYNGPAQPQVLQFSAARPGAQPQVEVPTWSDPPAFGEHSYRGFCGNGLTGEMLLFNIWQYDRYYWNYRDAGGKWSHTGKIDFPPGTEYDPPHSVRLAYPELAVRDRTVHFLGVSDITEPVKAWREYKLELNKGRAWDYDFRRLFYAWTPDITSKPFSQWLEVASREKTAGHITNLDLWLDKAGRAHLLWNELSVWNPAMRDKFFPNEPITTSLHYGIVDQGKLVLSKQLFIAGEGQSKETPGYARFQATPDGRLFIFYYVSGANEKGQAVNENRVMEIFPDGSHSDPVRVPLEYPFTSFMTATERGGSPPSNTLEVLGATSGGEGIRYARISLLNPLLADFTWTTRSTPEGNVLSLDAAPSRCATGKLVSWKWQVGSDTATGVKIERKINHGGLVRVTLTVKDSAGNTRVTTHTVLLPPTAQDLGLARWGLVLRVEAEQFAAEGGGVMHIRADKLAASGLSLSHSDAQGHWLEWEVNVPTEDQYYLLARYAVPTASARALTVDGQSRGEFAFPATGGYGSDATNNWALAYLQAKGKGVALALSAGKHTLRLENQNGLGLNLDYLELIAAHGPLPAADVPGWRRMERDGYHYLMALAGTLAPTQITHEIGFDYNYNLGGLYPGDGTQGSPASSLKLFEDGKELGPAHVAHVEIREKGKGRYAHWKDFLYFSASDNSDPRTNGKRYTWTIAGP